MTNVTSIDTPEGNVKIDSDVLTDLFRRYKHEAAERDSHIEEIKEIEEEAAKATGLKKTKIAKYFKSRYDFKTKDSIKLGELFEILDDTLDN